MTAKRRTIGKLAREVGVNVETIRFYEREGLIQQPRRVDDGYRHYDDQILAQVRYIRIAQQMGFTLKDVAAVRAELDHEHSFCAAMRTTVEKRLAVLAEETARLTRLKSELESFLQRCRAKPADRPCHTFEELTRLEAAVNPRPKETHR